MLILLANIRLIGTLNVKMVIVHNVKLLVHSFLI